MLMSKQEKMKQRKGDDVIILKISDVDMSPPLRLSPSSHVPINSDDQDSGHHYSLLFELRPS